jgi:hypothetical protein
VTKTNASSAATGNCNWRVLRIDGPSGGHCAACGLPYWNQPAYRIPGVKGWLSSILCAESILFGVGCCRWCGEKLNGQAHQRFCSDECAKRSGEVPFGNGVRLLNWLAIHHPETYYAMTGGRPDGKCRSCGSVLPAEKRSDSQFCNSRCRMRFNRKSALLPTTPSCRNSANSASMLSRTYESENPGSTNTP